MLINRVAFVFIMYGCGFEHIWQCRGLRVISAHFPLDFASSRFL